MATLTQIIKIGLNDNSLTKIQAESLIKKTLNDSAHHEEIDSLHSQGAIASSTATYIDGVYTLIRKWDKDKYTTYTNANLEKASSRKTVLTSAGYTVNEQVSDD